MNRRLRAALPFAASCLGILAAFTVERLTGSGWLGALAFVSIVALTLILLEMTR